MNAYFGNQPIFGPRGPAGPDGNPIGTVLAYLGLTPPQDYLALDGAEYEISQYPQLAKFFESQLGAANHYGGDGVETFKVPNFCNLFLRGYHGDSEERLSGEIGERQEATEHVELFITDNGYFQASVDAKAENTDYESPKNLEYIWAQLMGILFSHLIHILLYPSTPPPYTTSKPLPLFRRKMCI